MPFRQILRIKDPLLAKPSEPVDLSNGVPDEIKVLAADMLETSRAVNGAGMAAVQVGVPVRLFVMDLVQVAGDTIVFINPEIVATSEASDTRLEGCLSMPDVGVAMTRPAEVTVRYTDLNGDERVYEGTEFAARCILHEMDHLDGITMLDRMSPLKRTMALTQFAKKQKARR